MSDSKSQTTPPMGALPPDEASIKPGDRADKRCVDAACVCFAIHSGRQVVFADMQRAIDAYLKAAKEHGWTLK